jgi:hypothetical protein
VRRAVPLVRPSLAVALTLVGLGCHGHGGLGKGDGGASDGAAGTSGTSGSGGAGAGSGGVGGGAGAAGVGGVGGGAAGAPPVGLDPGTVGMRRLSDAEYARTVRDLLGLPNVDATLKVAFGQSPDFSGGAGDYDNAPGHPPIPGPRYEAYFTNAVTFVAQAFASDALRARIVTCAPAGPADDACARTIIAAFGLRAWRRPLTTAEVDGLVALARAALTAGDDFKTAIQEPLVALLASESFLYRLELDPPEAGTAVRALTSYELASRLSYFVWSSMPDDALFELARTNDLLKPDVLSAQVTRLLADARADGFSRNFVGQWLNFRSLAGPPISRTVFGWTPAWQASMAEEASLFVDEVVRAGGKPGDLLTTDVNFVDGNLAKVYALPPPSMPDVFTRAVNVSDARKGYLGLAAFLTLTSPPTRTSPSLRGLWIDLHLLCLEVPSPPANEPPLSPTAAPRDDMDARLAMPQCGACHKLFEPVGIGLEFFDQIGSTRFSYPSNPNAAIGLNGALPDGTPYADPKDLADRLGKDPRVRTCARSEALTYALGRAPTAADTNRILAIDGRWSAAGDSLRELVRAIVLDDLFRYRRAEAK